jgi:hypothetical protein
MKKDPTKLVKDIANLSADLSTLTQDKVNETAPKSEEYAEAKLTAKQIAARDGVRYIEPKKKLPAGNNEKLKPEWRSKRDRDWEYVLGIFHGEIVNNAPSREPKSFWYKKWAEDAFCWWEIPVEEPVYLPRMIALHLAGQKDEDTGIECMKYHTFDYKEAPVAYQRPDSFQYQFSTISTNYRGRFVPIGAF